MTQLISLKISVQMSISTRLIWVFLYRGFFQYYFFAVLIPTPRGERCTTVAQLDTHWLFQVGFLSSKDSIIGGYFVNMLDVIFRPNLFNEILQKISRIFVKIFNENFRHCFILQHDVSRTQDSENWKGNWIKDSESNCPLQVHDDDEDHDGGGNGEQHLHGEDEFFLVQSWSNFSPQSQFHLQF